MTPLLLHAGGSCGSAATLSPDARRVNHDHCDRGSRRPLRICSALRGAPMLVKALGIVLLVLLLVLVGMNFLVVSNAGDRLRALQADVEQLQARAAGGGAAAEAGAPTPFDIETASAFAGEAPAEATVALSDRPLRQAVVAVT